MKRQRTDSHIPQHLLSVKGLTMPFVLNVLEVADEMKMLVARKGGDDRLKHKVLATAFYEPSTRTCTSFQAAMLRLGGSVVNVNSEHSSVKKGETLEDTIRCLSCYCDVIALRHPHKGSAIVAADVSKKSIINAGDGAGEHPTQAFLDLYTIRSELGAIGGEKKESPMVITFLGDLKNSRTVHSLVILLSLFKNLKFVYVAAKGLEMPEYLVSELQDKGIEQVHDLSLAEAITVSDVLYVTRVQKERFVSQEEYEAVAGSYTVDMTLLAQAKDKMIIMHPLPRIDEIHHDVDNDPRAAYFRQMENGMLVRMALLSLLLLRPETAETSSNILAIESQL